MFTTSAILLQDVHFFDGQKLISVQAGIRIILNVKTRLMQWGTEHVLLEPDEFLVIEL